jgi:hypothetical protein
LAKSPLNVVAGYGGWSRGHLWAVLELAGRLQRRGRTVELAQVLGNFDSRFEAQRPPSTGQFHLGDKVLSQSNPIPLPQV